MTMKNDFNDIEKQLPQSQDPDHDTITSLNNHIYVKKVRQAKKNSGSRLTLNSAFSTETTAPNTPQSAQKNQLSRTGSTRTNKSLTIPESLILLFKRQHPNSETEETDSLTGMLLENQPQKNNSFTHQPSIETNLGSNKFNQMKSHQFFPGKINTETLSDSKKLLMDPNNRNIASGSKNKTDQVFDVLSTIIHESNHNLTKEDDFYKALKVIIQQTEESQKRQKNNVAWMCTVLTFTFFLFMLFMVGLFAFRLYTISGHIMKHMSHTFELDSNISAPGLVNRTAI